MSTRLASAWLVLATLGASCVWGHGPPTSESLAAAEYGPAPVDHVARTRRFVTAEYAEYKVIDVEVTDPRPAWFGEVGGLFTMRDVRYGWAAHFRGYRMGFMGMQPIVDGEVFFRDNELIGVSDRRNGFRFVE